MEAVAQTQKVRCLGTWELVNYPLKVFFCDLMQYFGCLPRKFNRKLLFCLSAWGMLFFNESKQTGSRRKGQRPSSFIQTASRRLQKSCCAAVMKTSAAHRQLGFSFIRYYPSSPFEKANTCRRWGVSRTQSSGSVTHCSTISRRLGFSMAAATRSLSLICLLTETQENQFRDTTTPSCTDTISRWTTGRTCAADQPNKHEIWGIFRDKDQ